MAGQVGVTKHQGLLAFAKQTAVGTPATTPAFAIPIISGGVKDATTKADLGTTRATLARPGQYVANRSAVGSMTILAYPDPLGLLLYEAMGAKSVSGVSAPFHHVFTMADSMPMPMTVWSLVGDSWWKITDCWVQMLHLTGAASTNVTCQLQFLGFSYHELTSAEVAAFVYSGVLQGDDPRLKYIGSTVQLDAFSTTPVTVDNVESAELIITRTFDVKYGSSLTPTRFTPIREVDFNTMMIYDPNVLDWQFPRGSAFASATRGATAGQDLQTGSFTCQYGRHPADPTRYLKITSNGANWQYAAERPDADGGGGAIEITANGMVIDPGAGATEVTLDLFNDTASY